MSKVKIELTDQQAQNLFNFLGRVSLNGTEAPALVDILNVVSKSFQNHMNEKNPEQGDK